MGLNISQMLEMECFAGARVIAGSRGINREVHLVTVMEVPDMAQWSTEHELILTAAYPFKDNTDAIMPVVQQLYSKNVACFAIKLGRFINELPQSVIEYADQMDFPIIILPVNMQFDQVILKLFSRIVKEDYVETKNSRNLADLLQRIALKGGTLREITQTLADWCEGEVLIKNFEGDLLEQCAMKGINTSDNGVVTHEKQVIYDGRLYAVITFNLWQKTLSNAELEMIDSAIPAIIMILFHSSLKDARKKREESLNDLILGRMVYTQKNIKYLEMQGVNLSSPYIVCVLRSNRLQEEVYGLLSEVLSSILNVQTNNYKIFPITAKMKNCIVHLYQIDNELDMHAITEYYRKILNEVNRQLPNVQVSVGISRYTCEPRRINLGFNEAQRALELGEQIYGHTGIYNYDELSVEHLLSKITFNDEIIDFIQNEIGGLISYDKHQKNQLIDTLEQLLTGDSYKEIAERMFIHPKTLAYRKSSIEKILGEKVDDSNKRMRLYSALKLYRLNKTCWNDMFPE